MPTSTSTSLFFHIMGDYISVGDLVLKKKRKVESVKVKTEGKMKKLKSEFDQMRALKEKEKKKVEKKKKKKKKATTTTTTKMTMPTGEYAGIGYNHDASAIYVPRVGPPTHLIQSTDVKESSKSSKSSKSTKSTKPKKEEKVARDVEVSNGSKSGGEAKVMATTMIKALQSSLGDEFMSVEDVETSLGRMNGQMIWRKSKTSDSIQWIEVNGFECMELVYRQLISTLVQRPIVASGAFEVARDDGDVNLVLTLNVADDVVRNLWMFRGWDDADLLTIVQLLDKMIPKDLTLDALVDICLQQLPSNVSTISSEKRGALEKSWRSIDDKVVDCKMTLDQEAELKKQFVKVYL